tara:strand:+ start:234 stop:443 length:210 start_codon:yes stop_codon:yes gene_type:complete
MITMASFLTGSLLVFILLELSSPKKEQNIQLRVDKITPRDYIINKLSQNNLVWDPKYKNFKRKNKNDHT